MRDVLQARLPEIQKLQEAIKAAALELKDVKRKAAQDAQAAKTAAGQHDTERFVLEEQVWALHSSLALIPALASSTWDRLACISSV